MVVSALCYSNSWQTYAFHIVVILNPNIYSHKHVFILLSPPAIVSTQTLRFIMLSCNSFRECLETPLSPALYSPSEKAVKSSLSTQTTSSLDELKHTVNKMIHQLENRDGQSGEYCQATCGFASSTRETESPVEAPTNNSIINVYKRFVLDKARKE